MATGTLSEASGGGFGVMAGSVPMTGPHPEMMPK
jgi:hypothetical protein